MVSTLNIYFLVVLKRSSVDCGYSLGNAKTDIFEQDTKLHEIGDFPFVVDDGYITLITRKTDIDSKQYMSLAKHSFEKTVMIYKKTLKHTVNL